MFLADVRSMSNYYPYGMQIEAGSWSGGDYNYGYNGMLKEGIGKDISHTHFRNLSVGGFVGWWSPDPLQSKFPWQSPYISMDGNPIKFIDNRGDSTYISGDDKGKTFNALSEQYPNLNLGLTVNEEYNEIRLEISGDVDFEKLSAEEQDLYNAITDDNINVNLFAHSSIDKVALKKGEPGDLIFLGTFQGFVNSKSGKKETLQFLNFDLIGLFKEHRLIKNESEVVAHEIIESYKYALDNGNSTLNEIHMNTYATMNKNAINFIVNLTEDKIYMEMRLTIQIYNNQTNEFSPPIEVPSIRYKLPSKGAWILEDLKNSLKDR